MRRMSLKKFAVFCILIIVIVFFTREYRKNIGSKNNIRQSAQKMVNTTNTKQTIKEEAAEFGILTLMKPDLAKKLINKARANPNLERALKTAKKSYVDILPRTEFGIDYTDYGMGTPALIVNVEASDQEIINFILKNKEIEAQ